APQSSFRQNSQPTLAAPTQSINPIFNRSLEGRSLQANLQRWPMTGKFMLDSSLQNNHHLAIEVRQLKKVFRKRKGQGVFKYTVNEQWAVKDVSFEVAPGETYGLLGPNGSGKSTLIRILSTLLIPDHGEVRLMGHRLPDEERAVRWKI